ncbi:tyrosine-type recombinase/integrase [Rhizobium phaseoli]|uniref:tyrosine-type recombinase/integrase n=1 Tax=Rhizobium phaseoli TaxID=396 RepID=UPI002554E225|nr:tyrosine-type recombinase/integrase [Rhizobium phaseoli]MDK4727416.1 tyrosine-type recombinase/integrase [Rhizobium phaseoli]
MTRENLKGLAKVKKTLASGKTIYYCYAWRGGPLLKNKNGEPLQPGDPLLVRAFVEETKNRHVDPSETLDRLIKEYRASAEFKDKAPKTRREYDRYLDMIRDSELAKMSFSAIQDKEARGDFKEWRDTMADRPRTADYAWTTLARVLSFAKDRGRISVNVCERGGRLYEADRTENIWTDDLLAKLFAVASADVKAAVTFALWTGQRKSDLLSAPWSDYDGKFIKVKQRKTGARVKIPAGKDLKDLLDSMTKRSPLILTNSRHRAWTSDGFDTSWQKTMKKAGIEGLTFHDLRGTAVTRLALAGCNNSQIASITGHSLRDVDAILDAHYLGGKAQLAEQAIAKLEAFQDSKK